MMSKGLFGGLGTFGSADEDANPSQECQEWSS